MVRTIAVSFALRCSKYYEMMQYVVLHKTNIDLELLYNETLVFLECLTKHIGYISFDHNEHELLSGSVNILANMWIVIRC